MTFSIALDNVRAGWVDVSLQLGAHDLDFSASGVASDPIRELAELGLALARRQQGAPVTFWLEPEGYELSATSSGLALHHARDAYTKLRPPKFLVVEQPVDPMRAAGEIRRCLRALHPIFVAAPPGAWSHPFPDALVVQLDTAARAY